MTEPDTFRASISADAPPADFSPVMTALWWVVRGPTGWDRAHALVQNEPGADAAWIHAHLHRVEGDDANAAYWYARAGRTPAIGEPSVEQDVMIAALCAKS